LSSSFCRTCQHNVAPKTLRIIEATALMRSVEESQSGAMAAPGFYQYHPGYVLSLYHNCDSTIGVGTQLTLGGKTFLPENMHENLTKCPNFT